MAAPSSMNFIKKHKILFIIAALLAFCLGWAFVDFMPTPLGDGLEYVGKEGYGCTLVCDSNPTDVYYYATSMTPSDIVTYFKAAKIENGEKLDSHEDASIPATFSLKSPGGSVFYITYHTNGATATKEAGVSETNKPHVIEILDSQYQAAKGSL